MKGMRDVDCDLGYEISEFYEYLAGTVFAGPEEAR